VGGGIKVHSTLRPLNGLLCQPRWNDWQGKPKYSEKTCPSAALSTTSPTCCPYANPGRRGGKPESNRWATARPTFMIRYVLRETVLLRVLHSNLYCKITLYSQHHLTLYQSVLGDASVYCIVTCVSVTIDGFWIDDRLYWTLWYSAWLQFTVTQTLGSTVTSSVAVTR
jgi:hypothetical protein